MSTVIVDFVARDEDPNKWKLVLVEQGPWEQGEIEARLTRLQERLYGCIDATLEGQVADQFPDSLGKTVAIRVDG